MCSSSAKPSKHEKDPLVKPEFDPAIKLVEKTDGFYLEVTLDEAGPPSEHVTW